jgi:hypothetical protein
MNKIIFSLASVLFFAGCEKVIEPKSLPQQDPMLVLNCILYNDSVVRATVSLSKSILSGKDYVYINNATCDLYQDDNFIERLSGKGDGKYEGATKPVSGKKYTLKVAAPGYNSVEGSTILGEYVPVSYYERYDTTNYRVYQYIMAGTDNNVSGNIKLKIRFKDNPKKKNYYSVLAAVSIFDTSGTEEVILNPYIYSNMNDESRNYFGGNSIDTDDQVLVNSNEVFLDVTISFGSYFYNRVFESASVYLSISDISEDLYKYKKTLNEQASAGIGFFAEPVLVHNNIQNGVGIMGSVNSNTVFVGKYAIHR